MGTIQQRLREFIKSEGLTVRKFEAKCGVSNGYVNNMRDSMGAKKLESVLNAFPDLSRDWLLYGKGEMRLDHDQSPQAITSTSGISVYDIDATCGVSPREMDFADENVIGTVHLPYLSTDTKIIRANGDSMIPTISDGDWVAVREIRSWDDIFYGQIYLVITEDYRMLKRIRRYEQDEDKKIILRSDNGEYDDMIFDRRRIKRLLVVDILSVKKLV